MTTSADLLSRLTEAAEELDTCLKTLIPKDGDSHIEILGSDEHLEMVCNRLNKLKDLVSEVRSYLPSPPKNSGAG